MKIKVSIIISLFLSTLFTVNALAGENVQNANTSGNTHARNVQIETKVKQITDKYALSEYLVCRAIKKGVNLAKVKFVKIKSMDKMKVELGFLPSSNGVLFKENEFKGKKFLIKLNFLILIINQKSKTLFLKTAKYWRHFLDYSYDYPRKARDNFNQFLKRAVKSFNEFLAQSKANRRKIEKALNNKILKKAISEHREVRIQRERYVEIYRGKRTFFGFGLAGGGMLPDDVSATVGIRFMYLFPQANSNGLSVIGILFGVNYDSLLSHQVETERSISTKYIDFSFSIVLIYKEMFLSVGGFVGYCIGNSIDERLYDPESYEIKKMLSGIDFKIGFNIMTGSEQKVLIGLNIRVFATNNSFKKNVNSVNGFLMFLF